MPAKQSERLSTAKVESSFAFVEKIKFILVFTFHISYTGAHLLKSGNRVKPLYLGTIPPNLLVRDLEMILKHLLSTN